MRGILCVLLVVAFMVVVPSALVSGLRQAQEWRMMIQPPGVPAVPRAPTSQGWTPLYDRWEACEAERVRLIQADILQARQPTPLVCQGLYSWWELVKRSSPRMKRNRQSERTDRLAAMHISGRTPRAVQAAAAEA